VGGARGGHASAQGSASVAGKLLSARHESVQRQTVGRGRLCGSDPALCTRRFGSTSKRPGARRPGGRRERRRPCGRAQRRLEDQRRGAAGQGGRRGARPGARRRAERGGRGGAAAAHVRARQAHLVLLDDHHPGGQRRPAARRAPPAQAHLAAPAPCPPLGGAVCARLPLRPLRAQSALAGAGALAVADTAGVPCCPGCLGWSAWLRRCSLPWRARAEPSALNGAACAGAQATTMAWCAAACPRPAHMREGALGAQWPCLESRDLRRPTKHPTPDPVGQQTAASTPVLGSACAAGSWGLRRTRGGRTYAALSLARTCRPGRFTALSLSLSVPWPTRPVQAGRAARLPVSSPRARFLGSQSAGSAGVRFVRAGGRADRPARASRRAA